MLLNRLHAIAASRGDGLRPGLLDLFERRALIAATVSVVDLAARKDDGFVQAGPNPVGRRDENDRRVVDFVPPIDQRLQNGPRAAKQQG